jgi:hypothetical protein
MYIYIHIYRHIYIYIYILIYIPSRSLITLCSLINSSDLSSDLNLTISIFKSSISFLAFVNFSCSIDRLSDDGVMVDWARSEDICDDNSVHFSDDDDVYSNRLQREVLLNVYMSICRGYIYQISTYWYICIYAYLCIRMYIFIFDHTHVHIHTCIHMNKFIYKDIYIYVYMCTYLPPLRIFCFSLLLQTSFHH